VDKITYCLKSPRTPQENLPKKPNPVPKLKSLREQFWRKLNKRSPDSPGVRGSVKKYVILSTSCTRKSNSAHSQWKSWRWAVRKRPKNCFFVTSPRGKEMGRFEAGIVLPRYQCGTGRYRKVHFSLRWVRVGTLQMGLGSASCATQIEQKWAQAAVAETSGSSVWGIVLGGFSSGLGRYRKVVFSPRICILLGKRKTRFFHSEQISTVLQEIS
jgi:hypothetical protein